MNRLDHRDLLTIISAIGELNSDFDPQTLTRRTLAAAAKVVSAESAAFTGFTQNGAYADLMWTNNREYSAEELEIFAAYIHENPLFEEFIVKKRAEVLKITDLISPNEFKRTNIYNEFYKPVGVSNQLVTPMRVTDDLMITCTFNTEKSDFSERDKAALAMLAPHLADAIRSAFAYRRLSEALDTEACGIVALNSSGKPVFISEYARRIFKKYFADEKRAGDALPETLNNWIKKMTFSVEANEFEKLPSQLKITGQTGELTASLAFNSQTGERTLMLEEKRFAAPQNFMQFGLTKRESEILILIAQGKTDEIIARFCGISPRTVHKHVQNIYVKLGVETRTAAMLRALETL